MVDNFVAAGLIVEVLMELLTPILSYNIIKIYDMFDIYVIYDIS